MARNGPDYGMRLVDRELLEDTRWAMSREENPEFRPSHGHSRAEPVRREEGFDFGLRGSPADGYDRDFDRRQDDAGRQPNDNGLGSGRNY
jgi:hypothetical protein